MYAQVKLTPPEPRSSLIIPTSSLVIDGAGMHVVTVSSDDVQRISTWSVKASSNSAGDAKSIKIFSGLHGTKSLVASPNAIVWRLSGQTRKHRRIVIGTLDTFKDESAALKAISALRKDINIHDRWMRTKPLRFAELIEHYREEELAADKSSEQRLDCKNAASEMIEASRVVSVLSTSQLA
jgi:hypothetical protein